MVPGLKVPGDAKKNELPMTAHSKNTKARCKEI
jgi:hypothetical protein